MTTSLRCFATLGLLLVAPQVGAAASKARAGGPSVSIVAGGDVLLDRGVGRQIQKRGAAHVFSGIAPLLRGADLAFANLECPLARHAKKIARPPAFKADPKMGPALKSAGFDVLSLANNHALDCGRGGLQETLRAVGSARLIGVGAGRNALEAARPVVTTARGVRIAWVAASQFSFPHAAPDPAQPSVAMATAEALRQQVLAARAQADVVVLSLHWGEEYRASATKTQRELARVALEAGADVILGHHSHVLGPIEERESGGRKRLVAYSLGNLVFDSPPWNRAAHRSVLLHLEVSKRGLRSWKITPLQIQNGRPRVAGGRR